MTNLSELPKGWEEKELGEIAEVYNGSTPSRKKSEYWKGHILWATPTDISNLEEKYISDTKNKITEAGYKSCSTHLLPVGTILFTSRASIGHIAIAKKEICTNQGFKNFVVKKEKLIPEFLFYALKIKTSEIIEKASGSTFKEIPMARIKKIKIPVPPLSVQKRIVSILSRAEKLKEKRKQANELLKQLPQSIFLEMFGSPYKTPFPVKALNDVCEKITDGTHKTPVYTREGVPFLRVTDLTNSNDSKKFISKEEHEELIKRCKPEKGDVLYSKNGTIGIAKVVDWDYEFSIFVSLCLMKPKKQLILPQYLEAFLNTPFALQQAVAHSKKGTITNLHLIEIKKIKIPLPPIKQQKEFIQRINQFKKIKKITQSSEAEINTLFDSLMQKAFKGELVS